MIDIWRFRLDDKTVLTQKMVLSPDEVQRSERFVFAKDKERYVIGRTHLRLTLASYTGTSPKAITFLYNKSGKPSIDSHWQFNCSHSHDLFVIAIANRISVGIDIEHIRPIKDIEGMMRPAFTREEQEFVRAQPPLTQQQAFYRLWTRKEAVLKALGTGIGTLLKRFSVLSPTPSLYANNREENSSDLPAKWHLTDITGISDQYVCAVCREMDEQKKQPGGREETEVVFRN